MNRKALLMVLVPLISTLFIGITRVATADSVIASKDNLLGKYETSDKEFKRIEIGNKIVYYYQRTIDGAIVEGEYILYQFNKHTKEFLDKKTHWRTGLPEHVPPAITITKERAESMVGGKVQFTKLYIISPESVVFPIKPTPQNPCWVVRSVENGNLVVTIIDAIDGKILGYGIPPPYTAFSLTGPDWGSCDPLYTTWAHNAELWFEIMGYSTEMVDCPSDTKVRSYIQSTETAMFYELAHGDSYSFHNICPDSENITATEVETWIKNYTKMPFTFLGSCEGMCETTDGTLSYEFRKGSTEDTVTVGYCGMGAEECSDAWDNSKNWQDAMFNYMNQGNTVKEAFNKAMADFPMCVGCMRFVGDENFAVVPIVKRVNRPPNTPLAPAGEDTGNSGTSYFFAAATYDPDGDQVAYKFNWGDGTQSDWTEFVDSGKAAGKSHSWSNEGTYEVKAKAKDINGVESGWSDAHQIEISQAPKDLTINSISPDAAQVDEEINVIVTVANQGTQDVTKDFWVDIYYNPSSAPTKGQMGDSSHKITQTVPAGESIQVTFTHIFSSVGDHKVWAQVDTSDFVSETDEDNNIYGPHTIAVSERRHENESFSLPAGKWKMISIPFTLDDASPNMVLVDDLGEQNDTVWKLYRWNTANGSYDKYPYVGNFSPGKAFWIISKDAKTVDTGPGMNVTRQTDFVISLPSGWSQIGNPFPFSIDWNEVRVRRNAEVVSILEAQTRGWVRDKIWYWDGQSYLVYQAPSGTIDPYEGYWAKALFDCELLLPPDEAQGAKVSGQTVKAKEEFLQLKAKVGEFEDNYNFLGFSEAAKDTYDRLDVEEPPPISSYISLFFPHPEWGKNKGNYTQDIRAGISQIGLKQVWNFQIKTDQINQKIIVEWENTSTFPEDIHLYLTDSFWNVLANMREKCFYRFTSTSSLELFKIIATSEALPLPEDLDLIEVYTYPNPAHGKGAQFHFYLASPAKVSIKIYSISGELVKTLINEKACVAGAYEEFWKEHNDRGEKLARGVYIYIIQAGNSAKVVSKSGKIGLLD